MPRFFLSGKFLRKFGKRAHWALFLFLSIILFCGLAAASESVMWEVLSRYQSPVPMQPESEVKWLYEKRVFANNVATVSVRDSNNRLQCQLELRYNENGSLVEAVSCRIIRDEEICREKNYEADEPVLLNQTLIPGDWFNLEPQSLVDCDWLQSRKVKDRVGAVSFVDYLTIKKEAVTLGQALAGGMLNQENRQFAENKSLYTLSLLRGEGEKRSLVLRQLWAKDATFWLYEEKYGRRSWYLGSK
ncbi:hypothetical protein KAI46_10960 [bacterium]|nr:hypothetical protein [bacterium]